MYSPAITDFVFMVDKTSYMFVTGPDVIKTVTHEDVTKEDLGGAMTHNATSGVAHFLANDDADCCAGIRELLRYLPQNNADGVPPDELPGAIAERVAPGRNRQSRLIAADIVGKRAGGRVAARRLFLERRHHHGVEVAAERAAQAIRVGAAALRDRVGVLLAIISPPRRQRR